MTTTPILRCRITAHHNIDRPYDGTSADFARVLAEHEATVKALEATGADVIMEDSRPVNVRAKVVASGLPDVMPAPQPPMAGESTPANELEMPGFLRRK